LFRFLLSRGTNYDWIPESMSPPTRSETFAVADVIDMTAYMAQCDQPNHWDTVERFIRNHICEDDANGSGRRKRVGSRFWWRSHPLAQFFC
jgi:hypothetical protein